MKELVRYLLENICLDFQGDITLDQVREFLRKDDSQDARQLLAKLNQDGAIEDMLISLADVLKPFLATGIHAEVIREQVMEYSES